jgi:hypothetical protein
LIKKYKHQESSLDFSKRWIEHKGEHFLCPIFSSSL